MSAEAAPDSSCCTKHLGPEHSHHIIKNFFGVWHGDYSLADETFTLMWSSCPTSISEQNKISIRWKMNGVTGENMRIKTPLKPGSKVSFKGIDFIVLDECSGLIKEINMAQDLITFSHELELGHVSV
ncbi:hypothetical protein CDV31_000140 [Fusarium ambrosium]|uniref:SnoaL-like domain-containing protein n=1 Tax=Fusarium ambrosium TaxID=131363 RepID=A0A428V3H3_9HYPO|nr:hypothetical protein CDV31_000140 [Fusarium ambrosium]